MLLRIKGIGKIQDSLIELKGVTVIAGENNTGKSTYGKILYCIFNAFYNAKTAIRDERINDISRIINTFSSRDRRSYVDSLSRNIVDIIDNTGNEKNSENIIRKLMLDTMSEQSLFLTDEDHAFVDALVEPLKNSIAITDEEIQKTIVSRYFKNEFEGQINHVNRPRSTGNVSLDIQKKNLDVFIENNECNKFVDDISIRHTAIYIDTPFVMDDLSTYYQRAFPSYRVLRYSDSQINHRKKLQRLLGNEQSDNTVIEEVIINQKISNILSNIQSVTKGEFKEDKRGLMFIENGLKNPVPFSNVSTGIKSFLIVKRLLELGEIKERDILIFDEPEIHLHPAWQLQFAELLILLQKEFNLTILLTTHSPYFLNAIEVYGEKHNIKELMKFYLAVSHNDISNIQDITDNIDIIYKQLAMPFQKLENTIYDD